MKSLQVTPKTRAALAEPPPDPDPVETYPWVDIDPDYEQYPEVLA